MKQKNRNRIIVLIIALCAGFVYFADTGFARGRIRPTEETTAPAAPDSSPATTESSEPASATGDASATPPADAPGSTPPVVDASAEPSSAPTQEEMEAAAQVSGMAVASLSTDFSSGYVVSTRSMTSTSGNVNTVFLMYTRTEDVLKTLSAMYEQDLSAGDIKIAENAVTNSIVIRAKDPANPLVKDILDVIRSLDFRPGQVLIDVLVVELKVNDKDLFDFELKALGRNPMGTSNTMGTVGFDHGKIDQGDPLTTSTGFKTLITSQNKLKLFLNAAKTKDRVNIISSPHIVAANHRKATFKIGDKIPIITSVRPSDAGPIKTFEIKEVGIELSVTPHINRSEEIDMEVLQTINNLSSYNEVEGTAQMTNREVQTNITIANGETLILGGFIEDKKSTIESKIPGLSNLPFIGKAFTKKDKKSDKTEILVFMTPRILDTVEDGRNVTALQASKHTMKEKVAQLLLDRKTKSLGLPASQEIIIDRASRDWRYDFDTKQTDVLAWQVPPNLDPTALKLSRIGACPFGYGPSKRLKPPFIRTLLQPSDGFVFLKEFTMDDPAKFKSLILNVASNNAAAVYINGTLVDEDPMVKLKDGHDYEYWNRSREDIPSSILKPGVNSIVVLLGNDKTTTDGYLDMMLIGAK